MRALCLDSFGGPEALSIRELPDPKPGVGEVVVRTEAIGLNFADVYRRRGQYHLEGQPPYILGYEGAGHVVALGEGVDVPLGARVGFADVPFANATLVRVPFERLISIPDDISLEIAAAVLLQGLTAQYLLEDSHTVKPGETVLVHAAAGGVGSLLVQLATHRGARVLGLASSSEKCSRALALGAASAVTYTEDWVARARCFGGAGVDVAYDSVGSTLAHSLEAIRVGGHVVFYGMAGGFPAPVDPRMLMDTSRSLTGGDLWNVLSSRAERIKRSEELFGWVRTRVVGVEVSRVFPLAEGAAAHRLLESRKTTGKILLHP
jgi:NADPH2:quinone reductase